jgi:uncharacterized protein (TIGR03435 family)
MLTNVMQMGGGGGRQVVDETGLKGRYRVAVDISLADVMAMARARGLAPPPANAGGASAEQNPAAAASDPSGATVLGSIEMLGLKLEPRTAPITQLIVDHVEKTPTPN